jgi:hypothetical protein
MPTPFQELSLLAKDLTAQIEGFPANKERLPLPYDLEARLLRVMGSCGDKILHCLREPGRPIWDSFIARKYTPNELQGLLSSVTASAVLRRVNARNWSREVPEPPREAESPRRESAQATPRGTNTGKLKNRVIAKLEISDRTFYRYLSELENDGAKLTLPSFRKLKERRSCRQQRTRFIPKKNSRLPHRR